MDLALNNQEKLICHKTQTSNQQLYVGHCISLNKHKGILKYFLLTFKLIKKDQPKNILKLNQWMQISLVKDILSFQ